MNHYCLARGIATFFFASFTGLQGVKKESRRRLEKVGQDGDGDYCGDTSQINFRYLARTTDETRAKRPHMRQGPGGGFSLLQLWSNKENFDRYLDAAI